jgi:hypothetical protein
MHVPIPVPTTVRLSLPYLAQPPNSPADQRHTNTNCSCSCHLLPADLAQLSLHTSWAQCQWAEDQDHGKVDVAAMCRPCVYQTKTVQDNLSAVTVAPACPAGRHPLQGGNTQTPSYVMIIDVSARCDTSDHDTPHLACFPSQTTPALLSWVTKRETMCSDWLHNCAQDLCMEHVVVVCVCVCAAGSDTTAAVP